MTLQEYLTEFGKPLHDIGVHDWALSFSHAKELVLLLNKKNILLLGFDVYDLRENMIVGAWGLIEIEGEFSSTEIERSYKETLEKLENWRNENYLYVIVPNDRFHYYNKIIFESRINS